MTKKLKIILTFILIILVVIFGTYFSLTKDKFASAHFIQYNSSIAAELNTNYTLDLAYFIEKNHKDKISNKSIVSINFKNSVTTQVKSYKLVKSDSSKKYDIRNITLDVSFQKPGKEKVRYIEIKFDDNSVEEYPVGIWNFNVSKDKNEEKLVMSDTFPLVSNDFNGYNFSFTNTTANDIKVIDLGIDLNETSLENKPINIKPKGTEKVVIKTSTKNKDKFYIIKPKLSYVYNNKVYVYYPFATYYGFLNMTYADIDKEVEKTSI
ncbi:hypothetical protein PAECIP111892_00001 [Paenibacillus auburnensis]|uniref:DUF3298 domain-containing protein n=2 Tax=Paenibacillus auburnensis TaxID=2905649 RepID=A0ABN8FY97_9BACL|nr:hypothetical protein PAECIP111892_00001 [Paenibacillus auburnensis]